MKRILTNNIVAPNKMPLTKYGLDLIQDSYKELIRAISKSSFMGGYGLTNSQPHWVNPPEEITIGAQTHCVENVIYMNDNLYYMPSFVETVPIEDYYFFIDTYYISPALRFSDGTTYDTYQVEEIIANDAITITTPIAGHTYSYIGTYYDIEQPRKLNELALQTGLNTTNANLLGATTSTYYLHDQVWNEVDGGVGYENGWASYLVPQNGAYFKRDGDFVVLQGRIIGPTSSTVAFTLPVGFRPITRAKVFPAIGNDDTEHARVGVNTTGTVEISYNPFSVYVSLDGIRFPLD